MYPTLKTRRPLMSRSIRVLPVCAVVLFSAISVVPQSRTTKLQNPTSGDPVSKILLLRIVRAEDERRWDNDLRSLFSARNAAVRTRAALAAGRIGNEDAVSDLIRLLSHDDESSVRAMAAFALGEIESASAAKALLDELSPARAQGEVRARIMEALGKIAAALPATDPQKRSSGAAILSMLNFEYQFRTKPDRQIVLLGLTAVLRANPESSGKVVAEFLDSPDPRIRADAANTLARLKLKDGNDELRKLLTSDPDPVVRANAARVLGAAEDKTAFEALLEGAENDKDLRVRVSAIRALASLKDSRATVPLAERGDKLLFAANLARNARHSADAAAYPAQANELLEIAATLGRIRQNSNDSNVKTWLRKVRDLLVSGAPEVEIALARIDPGDYLDQLGSGTSGKRAVQEALLTNWHGASALAQGLGEIASLPDSNKENKSLRTRAEDLLAAMLDYRNSGININTLVAVHSEYAIQDVLRAYGAFKPKDLPEVLRKQLKESDVIVRGTAADLLGELPPDETNTRALIDALPVALADRALNDAALSILDALAKQKSAKANDAIKTALDSDDYLVRRRAVTLLKTNGAGDFSSRISIVRTLNTTADYERALARIGKRFNAVVRTSKGSFTVALLTDHAPLNVDNFIQLAKRGYFGGITIHRVVPNFVIQDGDPRGDGNGGPGYQIRCEINEVPYNRAAVGMALSGKDTGGSQWFVTHSPQPHLDGGYTVFGNVVAGMDIVDAIARGDVIRSISITESSPRGSRSRRR
jgi:cyclophilin family peptidyl-prolyl cis-trans isomerase/HEAT repeat protein